MRGPRSLLSLWSPLRMVAIFLPVLIVGAFMAANVNRWAFDVGMTQGYWSLSINILGPVCAALGAFIAYGRRTSGLDKLTRTGVRSEPAQYVRLLAELGLLLGAGMVCTFALSMVVTLSGSTFGFPRPIIAVSVLAWCLAFTAFGLRLAYQFPFVPTIAVAGLLGYVFLVAPLFVRSLHFAEKLTPYGAFPATWGGPTLVYSLLQALSGLALALWFLPASNARWRVGTSLLAVLALVGLGVNGSGSFVENPQAAQTSCAFTGRVELCLALPWERVRGQVTGVLNEAFDTFGAVYPESTRVVQGDSLPDGSPQPNGPIISVEDAGLPFSSSETVLPSEEVLLGLMLSRLGAPVLQQSWRNQVQGPPPGEVLVAWAYAAHDLPINGSLCRFSCYVYPSGYGQDLTQFDQAIARLQQMSDLERSAWLSSHRQAILTGNLTYDDFR